MINNRRLTNHIKNICQEKKVKRELYAILLDGEDIGRQKWFNQETEIEIYIENCNHEEKTKWKKLILFEGRHIDNYRDGKHRTSLGSSANLTLTVHINHYGGTDGRRQVGVGSLARHQLLEVGSGEGSEGQGVGVSGVGGGRGRGWRWRTLEKRRGVPLVV